MTLLHKQLKTSSNQPHRKTSVGDTELDNGILRRELQSKSTPALQGIHRKGNIEGFLW